MNRPYTVCHIFSALDGGIVGNFMSMTETYAAREWYGKLRSTFESNAILYGTITMLDFCDGVVSDLPKSKPIERKDFVAPHAEQFYVIALDCCGTLAHSQNYLERHGLKQHIIEVLTEKVSDEYLSYLKNLGISYIFAGQSDLNCEIAMQKLYKLFGIERLVIAGGGYTDWTFADAGMIDELSLVLAPAADGEQKVTVFERNQNSVNLGISFTLKEVRSLDGNAVWLRYKFNNAKG